VLCASLQASLLAPFPLALRNVLNGGGDGIIFAQYTTNLVDATADCKGIAWVRVDLDTANLIDLYLSDAR